VAFTDTNLYPFSKNKGGTASLQTENFMIIATVLQRWNHRHGSILDALSHILK
jgi:hypothetical protein